MSTAIEFAYDLCNDKPLRLIDSSLNRRMMNHTEKGFFMITYKRPKQTLEEAKQAYRMLLRTVVKTEFKYISVYGGYRYPDDFDDIEEYELALVIPIFIDIVKEKMHDFGKLKQFALELCRKFDQNSVLIFEPGKVPMYYDRDGNVVGKQESPYTDFLDTALAFFDSIKKEDKTKNFSYDMKYGCYLNPTFSYFFECVRRVCGGETTV